MGAYAALLSLSQTLNHTLSDHNPHLHLFQKDQLLSLQANVSTLLTFLNQHSHISSKPNNLLETRMIDVAYAAEDSLESPYLRSSFLVPDFNERNLESFREVLQEIGSIVEEATKIKVSDAADQGHRSSYRTSPPVFPDPAISSNISINSTIFEDDYASIINRINARSSDLEVIPIFGMGGLGKSTLARRLYEDSVKSRSFDRCVWIVVSQDYSVRKVLLQILGSIMKPDDSWNTKDDAELKVLVHKELFNRRYLVVVDDLWSTKAWDDIQLILPKDNNESRVLVTTRSSHIAGYAGTSPHEMNLLTEDQSWSLLEERVFGKGSCPSELKQTGIDVAKCCRGLPLLLVVVGGLLRRNITVQYWKRFSGKISSAEPTIDLQCSKVLSLSYDCLPLYLKPCFLYVVAFPVDSRIKVNRLTRLLIAEGFVQPSTGSKCLEEVAEECIDDLVSRSLLLVSDRRRDGRIKAVTVHDLLRDIGTLKSHQERFYYCTSLQGLGYKQRRLSHHNGYDLNKLQRDQDPMTRSLLVFSNLDHTQVSANTQCYQIPHFELLKVLDAQTLHLQLDPRELVHLRYLAIELRSVISLLGSLSGFSNLQTLYLLGPKIVRSSRVFHLPIKVWKMPSLRHLISKLPFHLEHPSNETVEKSNLQLQTLSMVANLELSPPVIEMLAHLTKLGVYYYETGPQNDYHLSSLNRLTKIEELEIIFDNVNWSTILELSFPSSLKKLSFRCRKPCGGDTDMNASVLDILPDVEVLKLQGPVCSTSGEWTPVEGQFEKLRYLELDSVNLKDWQVEYGQFPSLEVLVLRNMGDELEEIPSDIGDIFTLELIQMQSCEPSLVASVHRIVDAQHQIGNTQLQVTVADEMPGLEDSEFYESDIEVMINFLGILESGQPHNDVIIEVRQELSRLLSGFRAKKIPRSEFVRKSKRVLVQYDKGGL